MQPMQMLPPIKNWGLSKKFEIILMTLTKAAKSLNILRHCGCKRGFKGCMCRKIELLCTELCKCSGKCSPWSVFIWSISSDNKHYILFIVWYIVCYIMISVYGTLEVPGEFYSIKSAFILTTCRGNKHFIFA